MRGLLAFRRSAHLFVHSYSEISIANCLPRFAEGLVEFGWFGCSDFAKPSPEAM
jgi:hypothetical protein